MRETALLRAGVVLAAVSAVAACAPSPASAAARGSRSRHLTCSSLRREERHETKRRERRESRSYQRKERRLAHRCHVKAEPAPAAGGIHKIQHVVVIMQENRSFDSYFGTYPGADG